MIVPYTREHMTAEGWRKRCLSKEWKAMAKEVRIRAGQRCERCGERNKILEVHHKVYTHVGTEREIDDLEALCPNCHHAEHGRVAVPQTYVSTRTGAR
jgi:5-methylcytosine-specific restriction endonuclease McrA